MKINYFNESNYGELCRWWENHNHAIIPFSSLPLGVVISSQDSNKHLAMAFVYTMDGCDVAQLAWTTTNPENTVTTSYKAVSLAVDALLQVAHEKMNKKLILCFSSSGGLSKILNRKNIMTNKKHTLNIGSF